MQVQYTYELHAARFSFWVAPGAWLVHVHLDRRKHKAQQKDWTVGWSCWPRFLRRMERE
jgi:hypothetical protein